MVRILPWFSRGIAAVALAVVAWAALSSWGAVSHGHPAYAIWLALTAAAAIASIIGSFVRAPRGGWRAVLRVIGMFGAVVWVAGTAWLRPATAIEPALAAMESDEAVTVTETATSITLAPAGERAPTAVVFEPGALVEARSYAAVLRPLAEAGHLVVITKPALGIAFLDTGALESARGAHPEVDGWVVGGHSLGGVVAAVLADRDDSLSTAPAVGLLLFASYPASDISGSLTAAVESISGSEDGLSTPEAIEQSRSMLPAGSSFTVIEGAVHAQFGDYGPQAGDGTATLSDDEAREQISAAALAFVDSLGG
ncbi:alpha/beta hydrolase [Demequina sp. SYSU T00039]|uniref:Alpha/beta hydrolase n=1 Tax=Demequina lignilytica TaxID=3051663 RepID=A0AAW7M7W1_9MICO|nr:MULTISPECIES: alpha/beta hydrolase [unclassified Demequina]MDN4477102.1 alpha/beta hydrolase [Demequina sp. SYSU T00039-1]MDN4487275.1 alpha/beta hydrolase [Demequina sp. SYSU T00039]MDN4491526.1 alpha/beta hydrolase [Demequina sp. SYSU T00068]